MGAPRPWANWGLLRQWMVWPSLMSPCFRLASELQALKWKWAAIQSDLKASTVQPLRPGQQGTGAAWLG